MSDKIRVTSVGAHLCVRPSITKTEKAMERYISIPVSFLLTGTGLFEENGEWKDNYSRLKAINLKSWYTLHYPHDSLGRKLNGELTLLDVFCRMSKGEDIYKIIGVIDSFVRESIFKGISEIMGIPYFIVYYMWLENEDN